MKPTALERLLLPEIKELLDELEEAIKETNRRDFPEYWAEPGQSEPSSWLGLRPGASVQMPPIVLGTSPIDIPLILKGPKVRRGL